MDYAFCLLTLKSSEKWRSPLFGATCNFNEQILPYGVYRHLKDRTKPISDKLKLVRLVWKSKRIFLQNKEQVLIDFLSGLIFNKKRFKLTEDDVYSVWHTLSELTETRKSTKTTTTLVIIKPSICQVINDNISQQSRHHHYVVQCCQNLLQSSSLSHVYNKFDLLSTLLGNLLPLIVKSADREENDESQWNLLQIVLPKYLHVQRSHPNQKMVLQTVTDKLLTSILLLWNHSSNSKDNKLENVVIKLLHNALFNKDHSSSYSAYLYSIVPDSSDKTQPPKHIENFFNVLKQCVNCKSLQCNIPPERLRSAALKYIPVYFKEFLSSNKITDCSTAKDFFVYFCKLLGVNISTSKTPEEGQMEYQGQQYVLEVIGHLLGIICDTDLYDKSHDPVYRQLLQLLLTCDRSHGYFTCLINLVQLNHLIVEFRMETILQQSCTGGIQDVESLDKFLIELVQLYSKLRQMDKFVVKLVNVILSGNVKSECLFTEGFRKRFCCEVEQLPQGTSVEIWQTLVQKSEDNFLCHMSNDTTSSDLIPKFEIFVQLLTMYMSCAKLIDYTITDINKRKVKDIMVTMATQLTKLIDMCPHSKDKKNLDLVYPVMALLHTWGEVHLLMCQYTQHTDLVVEEPLQHPHWVSIVYYFITPMMAEKLYKLSLKTRRLQYLWELLLVQTLKSMWMTNRSRKQFVNQLTLTVPDNQSLTWNQKISDINERNFTLAKWKLFTDNFALYDNELSNTQLEICANLMVESVLEESQLHGMTLSSITRLFLKSDSFMEHRSLISTLISDVWRKLDNTDQWKIPKKMEVAHRLAIKNVFVTLGDKAWLQKDKRHMDMEIIKLGNIVKEALTKSVNNMTLTESFPVHLTNILSCLPLSFLDPVDQIRCFVGLFVVCYHGNYDLKKGCLPLLTLLVESSTGVLKAVDLNVFMNAMFKLYTHQNAHTLAKEVEFFVSTCIKSVCKERDLLEGIHNLVLKLKEDVLNVGKKIKKNETIVKQQEAPIQLTSLLIQQLYWVINRPYVREDILSLCQKYVEILSVPVFDLLNALRKRADCDPVLSPVTQIYSLLLNQFEKMKEGKNSQKIFEHVMKWSLEQLQCEEKMTSERLKAAIDFLKQSCRQRDSLELPHHRKTEILDQSFVLLKQHLPRKLLPGNMSKMETDQDKSTNDLMETDQDKSTCDLMDSDIDKSEDLLSLVSTVIVSCDITHFKDLLQRLEQSVNIDPSVTECSQVTVCLYIWYHLLSCDMSEEQSSCFVQSIYNLTGYLTSLGQQLSSIEDSSSGIDKLICDLQHKILLTCPVTKQMILTMLQSVLLIPVTMETFSSMYEILNEVLLNHYNTVFDIIPVFLSCSKHLLFFLIKQGNQDVLSKTPDITADLIGCVHMIDRLFTLISTHKEEFSKVVVYVIADYVDHVNQATLLPIVKKALVSAIYKLLDIGDKHILAQLHTVLNQGVREVFKGLYSDYTNFYKYTGKV